MKNQIPKLAVCMLIVFNLSTFAQNKVVFNHTGSDQFYTVPAGVTQITVKAWGAGGAGGNYIFNDYGGGGGYATGVINVTPGDVLKVIVGGGGKRGKGPGAYGGGGAKSGGYASFGGRGGGRSAIRNSSDVELLTAGAGAGGGGSDQSFHGGAGGGGGYIGGYGNFGAVDGQPGTQTAGGIGGHHPGGCTCGSHPGSQFQGGEATAIDNGYNGSGGGGYYGGGSGTDYGDGGGGGGSSFVPEGGCTVGATDFNAANNTDKDYKNSAGLGGQKDVNGKNGRVVLLLYGFCAKGTPVPISTNGACDGSISFDTLSGTPPYTFLWSDGYTSGTRNNICPGVYYITITDAMGCNKTVKRKWFDPASFLHITFTDASSKYCADGSLTATIDNFSPDSNAVFTLYDATNTIVETWNLNTDSNPSHTFTNLIPGLYTVVATAGIASTSKSGNVNGPCTFSFNDVTIDSVQGCSGMGSPNNFALYYNGQSCDTILMEMKYYDFNLDQDIIIPFSSNYYGDYVMQGGDMVKYGVWLIGHNGTCVDSTFFHPDPIPCQTGQSISVTYESCGASISGIFGSNFCNPGDYVIHVDGITNNIHQSSTSLQVSGLPDGDYSVYTRDAGCSADTEIITISGATWAAPVNLTANQVGTSQMVKLEWEDILNFYCLYYNDFGFQVQVRKQGAVNWKNYYTPGSPLKRFKKINNIINDTIYEYRVRANWYPTMNGALWSSIETFCIGPNCGTPRIGIENENSNANQIKVEPNPAKDLIKISLEEDFDQQVDIKVYDQLGREVIAKSKIDFSENLQLNVSSLNNGLYIISIIAEGEKYSSRFIVNR